MKYIISPFIFLLIIILLIITGILRMIWILIWSFRKPTIRESFTFHDEYLFENWNWKELVKEMFSFYRIEEYE